MKKFFTAVMALSVAVTVFGASAFVAESNEQATSSHVVTPDYPNPGM